MAKKEKKEVVSEVETQVEKVVETRTFTVLKELTFDKFYRVGNTIELSNEETIEKLLTTKYIK